MKYKNIVTPGSNPLIDIERSIIYLVEYLRKDCSKCKENKLLTEYGIMKGTKDNLRPDCKKCHNLSKNKKYYKDDNTKLNQKEYNRNNPWISHHFSAKNRCNNSNSKDYKCYGGRGIKFLLTIEETRELWFRDDAWKLKEPSIDRINSDSNYQFDNCRFIEKINNKRRY